MPNFLSTSVVLFYFILNMLSYWLSYVEVYGALCMLWCLCFVGHTKLSQNGQVIGEKDWLKNLIVKEREVKSGFVLERESAGIQLQGKFFVLDSVERWAAVACHQNITPFPSPNGSEERWPRERLLSGNR